MWHQSRNFHSLSKTWRIKLHYTSRDSNQCIGSGHTLWSGNVYPTKCSISNRMELCKSLGHFNLKRFNLQMIKYTLRGHILTHTLSHFWRPKNGWKHLRHRKTAIFIEKLSLIVGSVELWNWSHYQQHRKSQRQEKSISRDFSLINSWGLLCSINPQFSWVVECTQAKHQHHTY